MNMDLTALALGHKKEEPAKEEKPKKEIREMRIRKAHSGKHIVEHHHTSPEHHPMEEHVMDGMSDLHSHMEDTMGQPAQGEPEADAGQSGIEQGGY